MSQVEIDESSKLVARSLGKELRRLVRIRLKIKNSVYVAHDAEALGDVVVEDCVRGVLLSNKVHNWYQTSALRCLAV